jgi:hypothetical protein
VEQDRLFERLWTGDAAMEEWTAAVSGVSAKPITVSVIAIHTGYLQKTPRSSIWQKKRRKGVDTMTRALIVQSLEAISSIWLAFR